MVASCEIKTLLHQYVWHSKAETIALIGGGAVPTGVCVILYYLKTINILRIKKKTGPKSYRQKLLGDRELLIPNKASIHYCIPPLEHYIFPSHDTVSRYFSLNKLFYFIFTILHLVSLNCHFPYFPLSRVVDPDLDSNSDPGPGQGQIYIIAV